MNLAFLPSQDPHAEEFEDKEWTFVIENVSGFEPRSLKEWLDNITCVLTFCKFVSMFTILVGRFCHHVVGVCYYMLFKVK